MSKKIRILFICQHNTGRSQIAELYQRKLFRNEFIVKSAGMESAEGVNPLVVEVMYEEGFDLSAKKPQSVFALFKADKFCDHVVTLCNESGDKCPLFPGVTKGWHWHFPVPANVQGSDADKLNEVRRIRDRIKDWLRNPPVGTIDFQALVQ